MNRRRALRLILSVAVPGGIVLACAPDKAAVTPSSSADAVRCPDLGKADEIAAFDFAKEYALKRDASESLKAAALAAMELTTLSEKIDAEFGIACAQVASDLGHRGELRSGGEACAAALKTVQEARAKLGPKAKVLLVVRPPSCLMDVSLLTKCASLCDSLVPADKVRAECEQTAGRCEGNCDGVCEPTHPNKCDGVCQGTCDGPIKGTCGGRCIGTCDGKRVSGGCLGVCVGSCEKGAVDAECRGTCNGACKLSKAAICDGTCSGTCSVELEGAKCAGDIKPPAVSADCRAECALALINKTECGAPQVGFVVTGAKEREIADAMKVAVDKSFPGLIKILNELGPSGGERVEAARTVVDRTRSAFREMARAGGAASSEKALVQCFEQPFKKASEAASSITSSLRDATGVRDEGSK